MKPRAVASLALAGAAVSVTLAIVSALACGTPDHVFAGRRFNRTNGCLDPVSLLDVVRGADPGSTCDPLCFVALDGDGGVPDLYISRECGPYPPLFETSGKDPDCARAFAAFANGPSCLPDGGVGSVVDAGTDAAADTGTDATGATDATTDAATD